MKLEKSKCRKIRNQKIEIQDSKHFEKSKLEKSIIEISNKKLEKQNFDKKIRKSRDKKIQKYKKTYTHT